LTFLSITNETAQQLVRPDGCVVNFWVTPNERRERAAVLLHGLASNHTRFDEFAQATTLTDSWCLVRPDLRGQGLSRWRGRISARVAADDIAALLDQLRYRRAALIGHSLGASVALEFARAWPERTEALVLIEPNFGEALQGGMRRARGATPLLRLAIAGVRIANPESTGAVFPTWTCRRSTGRLARRCARVGMRRLPAAMRHPAGISATCRAPATCSG
jgi:pimeloyl-ACP methyl ester carboxylesterase